MPEIVSKNNENPSDSEDFFDTPPPPRQDYIPAKDKGDKEGQGDQEVYIEKGNATLHATILQDYALCPLRGQQRIWKQQKQLSPSLFALEKRRDGKAYEEDLILAAESKEKPEAIVWKQLLQEKYPELQGKDIFLHHLPNIEGTPEEKAKKYHTHLKIIVSDTQPFLLYQTLVWDTITSEEGSLDRLGIIDAALWTGTQWVLGEIKLTTKPKTPSALQLRHYFDIWKAWAPKGSTTIKEVFILHCREGWEYERRASENRRNTCVAATKLTSFDLDLTERGYREIEKEITHFALQGQEPKVVALARFKIDCVECPFRLPCYKVFLGESQCQGGPRLERSGLDPSQILILEQEYGISTIKEALDKVETLKELHHNHPVLKEAFKRRFSSSLRLGGYSDWKPPKDPQNEEGYQPHQIFFYARTKNGDQYSFFDEETQKYKTLTVGFDQLPEELPLKAKEVENLLLIAYSLPESQKGFLKLREVQKLKESLGEIQPLCLQKEIRDHTFWPYASMDISDIAQTLGGIIEHKSWDNFAKLKLIPSLQRFGAKREIEENQNLEPSQNDNTRTKDLITLWAGLNQIFEETKPL